MSSTLEGPGNGSAAPLAPTLTDGLRLISDGATIPFTQYVRYVLPLDGYVFWLKTQTASLSGSLHVTATKRQNEDESVSFNHVVFTTTQSVDQFEAIDPNTMWVGEAAGNKFAFSQSGPRYRQAGLFHYVGDATNAALLTQLVDVGSQLPPTTLVVSNSLPIWLTLFDYDRPWLPAPNPKAMLYPSFLVPANLPPPYGAVHIEPGRTTAIQSTARIGPLRNHYQLVKDVVRITFYGLTNDGVMAFLDLVDQFTLDTDLLGLMNMPVPRDEKRTQPEMGILAMKKTIEFEVNYNQTSVRDTAENHIRQVVNQYFPANNVGYA